MFGSREDFFRRGFTTAVLKVDGKEPDSSEELTMLVRVGRNSSKHSKRRDVGKGSRAQDVGLDFKIVFFSSDSVTG